MRIARSEFIVRWALFSVAAIAAVMLYALVSSHELPRVQFASVAAIVPAFAAGVLQEAGSPRESLSPLWWLNSGGELITRNDVAETMQGDAARNNRWRIEYAITNPLDTDQGLHPQNLFRLVSIGAWGNVAEEVRFFIVQDHLSASPNRNESNGLLLLSRYGDGGQTLYYAGVRVDGTAVIKKKYRGVYYTLAQTPVYGGAYSITAATGTSQDLIPHGEWIDLRMTTVTNAGGTVTIALYMRKAGVWSKILEADDDGKVAGDTPPITGKAPIGIRTDFMDVQFSDITVQAI